MIQKRTAGKLGWNIDRMKCYLSNFVMTQSNKDISFRTNIDYNISVKGSENVKKFDQLDKLMAGHDGIIQTSQVVDEGISKPVFYDYVKMRKLEQVAHGVYASADVWIDAFYLIHLRCEQAIFSHETALFFHDLTDREPAPYAITVKTGYNPTRLKADGIQVYTVKPEFHVVGRTTAQTPFGHTVPVYDMERTICDLIRSRKKIEIQTFQEAMKKYLRRKDKNLRTLMHYAALFRVEKILRQYLEVLL